MVLCTDDSGVFATTLSREYALAAGAFHLTPQQLTELALAAVDLCFLDSRSKASLHETMSARLA